MAGLVCSVTGTHSFHLLSCREQQRCSSTDTKEEEKPQHVNDHGRANTLAVLIQRHRGNQRVVFGRRPQLWFVYFVAADCINTRYTMRTCYDWREQANLQDRKWQISSAVNAASVWPTEHRSQLWYELRAPREKPVPFKCHWTKSPRNWERWQNYVNVSLLPNTDNCTALVQRRFELFPCC